MKVLGFAVALWVSASAAGQSALPRAQDTEGREVLSAFRMVVEAARGSVVALQVDGRPAALGTVVGRSGLVLSKASELRGTGDDAVMLTADLFDGRRVAAKLLREDRRHDLALLQIEAEGLTPVELAVDRPVVLGKWLVVPGLTELPEAVGVYSVTPRRIRGVRLGIALGDNADGRAEIGATIPGMGAEAAGLQRGDVLISIGDTEVQTAEDVIESLQAANSGDVLDVVVQRGGREMTFAVEMRLRPLDPRSRADRMNTMGNGLSRRRDGFASVFQHDATIDPAQCGGPVLDLDGRCLGINIARAGRVEAYALPAAVVAEALAEMTGRVMVSESAGGDAEH
ncbi:MAG: trypsin-like peptidase domain-containing protein [Planctomycetota bacterium]